MKKIEILLPEIANLYGELGTINYFKQAFQNQDLTLSSFDKDFRFVNEDVDFIYMGALSEKWQKPVLEKLMPHKERLKELIEKGCVFLMVNTAFELFGRYIQRAGEKVEALGIFDFYTVQDFSRRYNQKMMLEMGAHTIVATKTQFSKVYGIEDSRGWMKPIIGEGTFPDLRKDGLAYKNFRGTHLTGPLVLLNPTIATWVYEVLNLNEKPLFLDLIKENHQIRLENYRK